MFCQTPIEPIRDWEGLQTCRLLHQDEPGTVVMQVRMRPGQDCSQWLALDQLKIVVPIKFAAGYDVIDNMHIVNKNRAAQSGRGRWLLLKHMEGVFACHGRDEPRPISVGGRGHFWKQAIAACRHEYQPLPLLWVAVTTRNQNLDAHLVGHLQ
jgi:hypothetical protein